MKKSELNKMVNDQGYRDVNGHKYKAKNMYISLICNYEVLVHYNDNDGESYTINTINKNVYINPDYYDLILDFKEYEIDFISEDFKETIENNDWIISKNTSNNKYSIISSY